VACKHLQPYRCRICDAHESEQPNVKVVPPSANTWRVALGSRTKSGHGKDFIACCLNHCIGGWSYTMIEKCQPELLSHAARLCESTGCGKKFGSKTNMMVKVDRWEIAVGSCVSNASGLDLIACCPEHRNPQYHYIPMKDIQTKLTGYSKLCWKCGLKYPKGWIAAP